jgi:hypothetical protein
MDTFKTLVLIIVSISFAFIIYSLTSNLWFFRKGEKIEGSKDLIISQILKLAYDCYEKNLNTRGSIICGEFQVSSKEDISATEIFSRLDKRRINENNFFVDDLHASSKIIIRYENGNIFIEEEKYESVSS